MLCIHPRSMPRPDQLYQHLLARLANLPSVTSKHSGRPVSAQLAPLTSFTNPGAAVKIRAWTVSVSAAWSPRRPLVKPDLGEITDGGVDRMDAPYRARYAPHTSTGLACQVLHR